MSRRLEIQKMIFIQLGIVLIAIGTILFVEMGWVQLLPECQFRQQYGIICPSCGMTRCSIHILHFQWKEAFLYHPTLFLCVIWLGLADVIYIWNTIFQKKLGTFFFPSLGWLYFFLSLFVIQYVVKLILYFLGIGTQYL